MKITTKEELLAEMRRLSACRAAAAWVSAQNGTADEIWLACDNIDWLIWFAGRRNPVAIAGFAKRCLARAYAYDDDAAAAYAYDNAYDAAAYAYAAAAAYASDAAGERALQLADLRTMLPSAQE